MPSEQRSWKAAGHRSPRLCPGSQARTRGCNRAVGIRYTLFFKLTRPWEKDRHDIPQTAPTGGNEPPRRIGTCQSLETKGLVESASGSCVLSYFPFSMYGVPCNQSPRPFQSSWTSAATFGRGCCFQGSLPTGSAGELSAQSVCPVFSSCSPKYRCELNT